MASPARARASSAALAPRHAEEHAAAGYCLAALLGWALVGASATAAEQDERRRPVPGPTAVYSEPAAYAPRRLSLPSRLELPDAYGYDPLTEGWRDFTPLDHDDIASFSLLPGERRRSQLLVVYVQESRGPLGGSADMLTLIFRFDF